MTTLIALFISFYSYAAEPSVGKIDLNLLKEYQKEIAPFKTEKKTSDFLLKANQSVLSGLDKAKPSKNSLTKSQAEAMNAFLMAHPIAGDKGIERYSQKNSSLGFCFGRATLAHMELLRRGVDPKSIRKIFVIGELKYTLEIWELHVATIVKKNGGGWWVLDGLFNKTLEVQEWYKHVLKIAVNTDSPKIRLYLADPVKFLPITGAYSEKDMYKPEYNGFFKDLSLWLNQNPPKKEHDPH